nr:DUF2209 family protein [Halalkalicoccus subterraneus]
MVSAAVAASVGSNRIREVTGIDLASSRAGPTLTATLSVAAEAVGSLPDPPLGAVVAERGGFHEWPEVVDTSFDPEFTYAEPVAERRTVEIAHQAAYAARTLIL